MAQWSDETMDKLSCFVAHEQHCSSSTRRLFMFMEEM